MAQPAFTHKLRQKVHKTVKAGDIKAKKALRVSASRQAKAALLRPAGETVYYYDAGEWVEDSRYTYEYDSKGNVTTEVLGYETDKIKTVYGYDADGRKISEQTSYSSEDGPYENTEKKEYAYDPIVKDFIVENSYYSWADGQWNLDGSQGTTWIKNVKRNADSKVTGVAVKTYFQNQYSDLSNTYIEYGADGKAKSWRYDELYYDGVTEAMEEYYTLSDLKWHETDGQIVARDIEELFVGNNRLTSATVTEPEYGVTGTLTGEYQDNGDYSVTSYYMQENEADVLRVTHTDGNGSYIEYQDYYIDANADYVLDDEELDISAQYEVVYDECGYLVQESFTEDGMLMEGAKYEYRYMDGCDYPVEQIHYTWNPDIEDYEPFLKVVATDFRDVTNSIKDGIQADGNVETAVYNVQGVKMGSSVDSLPSGLYIVKSAGKTTKVLKK